MVCCLQQEAELQRRCDRNRKRSKRRAIYCLIHDCYLESVSQKYPLFADQAGQLQQRGVGRKQAMLLMATKTTVPLQGEWLEAFWCPECQKTVWYHVHKIDNRAYRITPAPVELWQQVAGVIHPEGNPTVGEFTRRQSRLTTYQGIKDFQFVV
jgi:hypothetical protein